ncbi:mechanosensitive ion channel domain-containing protein [Roseibacillus ishigakijimensis]|uniref:Mechanosensitive ion channel n=1 Tax=Roseibacillus ishigakijimensis TaxID=454146 RepID=A0A934RQY9_9BACT|nr:mechanosensitive ion channel domain-containing protein [Roseibacillus ishigakijimensis]MBK1832650.1 mechanosensitive ion channel [Roseibacillus ishigakijimensis]
MKIFSLVFIALLCLPLLRAEVASSADLTQAIAKLEEGNEGRSAAELALRKEALALAQQREKLSEETKSFHQQAQALTTLPEWSLPEPLPVGASLESRNTRLAEVTALIDAQKQRLEQLTHELDRAGPRLGELSGLLATTRDELGEVSVTPGGTSPEEQAEEGKARQLEALLAARIENLQAEQNLRRTEQELLPEHIRSRRDYLEELQTRSGALQTEITRLRQVEIESTREALEQSSEKFAAIPSLSALVDEIRGLNALRTGEEGLLRQKQRASSYSSSINATRDRIRAQWESADQKISLMEKVGMGIDTDTGILLREQRAKLPSPVVLRRTMQEKIAEAARAQIALLDVQDLLSEHPPLSSRQIGNLVAKYPELYEEDITSLLDQRKDALEALSREYRELSETLERANATADLTIQDIEAYSTFLDKRLLWIKSTEAIRLQEPAAEWNRIVALFAPASWQLAWQSIRANWVDRFLPVLVLLTLFLFASLRRRRLRKLLRDSSAIAARRNCTSIQPTLQTIVASLLLAATAPSLLFLLALLISEPAEFHSGLLNSGILLFVAGSLLKFTKSEALFEAHFRFSAEKISRLRRNLQIFTPLLLPFSFGVGALCSHESEGSGGRVVFILAMIVVAVLAHRLFHPKHSLLRQKGGLTLLCKLSYALALGLPLSFAIGAAFGFFASVLTLRAQVVATAGVLLAAFLVIRFFMRWILVSRRRLAISQALQRREAILAERSKGKEGEGSKETEVPSLEEVKAQAVNVVEVEEQTNKLVRFCVYFSVIFAIWSIWASSLKALSILDQVPVVPGQEQIGHNEKEGSPSSPTDWVPGVSAPVAEESAKGEPPLGDLVGVPDDFVSWQDVLLSAFFFFLTFIAARNIPGLLSLSVFNRLNLGPGGNFAFTTVVRYFIVFVGVFVGLAKIGITWDKVQWLAAAITLGIGFGLQEIFANFVAGLILLFERPIRLGDIVTVGEVSGKVTEIRMRATTIQQFNNRELVVPNKDFITNQLNNWTLRDTVLRFEIPVGIAYGSDTRLAKQLLEEILENHPYVLADPAPAVVFNAFGESTLDFLIRAYVGEVGHLVDTQSELHFQIDDAFRAAGVEIAFPQQDLNLRTLPEGLVLQAGPPRSSAKDEPTG